MRPVHSTLDKSNVIRYVSYRSVLSPLCPILFSLKGHHKVPYDSPLLYAIEDTWEKPPVDKLQVRIPRLLHVHCKDDRAEAGSLEDMV